MRKIEILELEIGAIEVQLWNDKLFGRRDNVSSDNP